MAKLRLPTRLQLFQKMQQQYPNQDTLTRFILMQCAEIAEREFNRMLFEYYTTTVTPAFEPKTVVVETKSYYRRSTRKMLWGYVCPACKTAELKLDYKYCPICSAEIQWQAPRLKKAA